MHRLTDQAEPFFSPDGSRVAFRSERDGGGLYVVSALGGGERVIAKQGRNPRFSPDGKWIAYWVGEPHFTATGTRTQLYRAPAGGGSPMALASELLFSLVIRRMFGRERLAAALAAAALQNWRRVSFMISGRPASHRGARTCATHCACRVGT